jgi:hypothetical protein
MPARATVAVYVSQGARCTAAEGGFVQYPILRSTDVLGGTFARAGRGVPGLVSAGGAAFLLALEALDPKQRAVIVLRDVLGMSGPETGEALSLSPENVRVILHRARKALEAYERERNPRARRCGRRPRRRCGAS